MATLFRGCLQWRPGCSGSCSKVRIGLRTPSIPKPRYFSSSILLQASKGTKPSPSVNNAIPKTKPPIPLRRPPISGQVHIYQPFAATLARKVHPTILYQAPSHTLFIVSSYTGALLCFSYAAFNFEANYMQAPEGIATWVPLAFVGVCTLVSAFGVWVFLAPARLVRTITAIPRSLPGTRAATRTNPLRVAQPDLQIEIELRKVLPIPFLSNWKIYASPKELILPRPLAPPDLRPNARELEIAREREEEENARQLEYERTHIMSAPFRHAGRIFMNFFRALARAAQREGFMKAGVRGQTIKIDVMGGWALDRGRALDRLATVKSPF